ncbi:MAG: NAD(P)/FAD-dependent oxidoreductase [Gammaproteobacteria bacterium]|nr:NAD(P)/FAD-dependent oxidoreductase [Gammaproteobacteria bacterium]
MDTVECIVIGAGVIGLACARRLAEAGREVIVLERNELIGAETSSRNSEVIHAGIYYPTGSLKAQLCVAGKRHLYEYCKARGVPHQRCGKIIVATRPDQIDVLENYQRQAEANGVALQWLDERAVHRLEPEVNAVAGLLSESTGIIDSHAYMLSLQGDAERAGTMIAFDTEVQSLQRSANGGGRIVVATPSLTVECEWLINCAGLWAPAIAGQLVAGGPDAFYARGHYFAYDGASPFSRLVYPIAEPGGLGVHVTMDMGGQIKFGPDVMWVDGVDYSFDEGVKDSFVTAIRHYFPAVDPVRLHPSYTGIRPKISGPGAAAADFRIDGEDVHGVGGLINLLGIESPGLTASLAIADAVGARVMS